MCSLLYLKQSYSGGHLYDGQYIVNNTNVILVTINYRLGAIGFLVFGDGSGAVKGNYGFQVSSGCEFKCVAATTACSGIAAQAESVAVDMCCMPQNVTVKGIAAFLYILMW